MNYITITYELVWRVKSHKYIQFTEDKRMCFNIKIGKKKEMYKGVWLDSKKFLCKSNFDANLELIPEHEYLEDNFLNKFNHKLSKNI